MVRGGEGESLREERKRGREKKGRGWIAPFCKFLDLPLSHSAMIGNKSFFFNKMCI